ncbi:DUF5018 domain-containing protein [Maribacter sp. 2304DJ31-5]|uniref:DUF5018 domain-containing protein n=1 Tax=Maribacter sp. 2304DJ31-5 TaxID=3386273 RepID=UPI0039BD206E
MKKIAYFLVLITMIACSSSSSEEPLQTGNSITSFQMEINGEVVSGQINQTNNTITLNVTDANLSSVTPGLSISVGAAINPAASTPRNFNQEVQYTVTAEDGTRRIYTVVVNNRILSTENSITLFELPINGETISGNINQDDNTITFDLVGADVSSLIPTITISDSASISPGTSSAQNFDDNVSYTVTAENGDERTYQVVVNNRPLNAENEILSFVVGINGESIEARLDSDLKEIAFETGSFNISRLIPEITVSEYATISPASGEAVDFTVPVTYTVTAENGETKQYIVKINQAYSIKPFGSWGFNNQANALLVYPRAKIGVSIAFLNPSLPGAQVYLNDGINKIALSNLSVEMYENQRVIYYQMTTVIPDNTLTSKTYKLTYEFDDLIVESDIFVDVLAEGAPKINSINQDLYRPGDTLIVTGENLTPVIVVPSNGSQYIFNPAGNIDTELNAEKTEYRLILESQTFTFAYRAFFFYSGDTREVIFTNLEERRLGEQITINVER